MFIVVVLSLSIQSFMEAGPAGEQRRRRLRLVAAIEIYCTAQSLSRAAAAPHPSPADSACEGCGTAAQMQKAEQGEHNANGINRLVSERG
ncbi:hypothetical protein [Jiella sonneratiae]|uniref:hypothetical protein n=1 Tax=Jiella sonneratiae TaxID=2816856 RepID=UPI001A9535A1|nr:hypothetical protein [Jiella sonneratiae]